jgi:hypothetical protein
MNEDAPPGHPSWKPRTLGPFSLNDFTKYLRKQPGQNSEVEIPPVENTFHFYNALLAPVRVMVSQDGKVKGILGWRDAAFYPRFWFTLKLGICTGFLLDPATVGSDKKEERGAWCYLLKDALTAEGFPSWEGPTKWWKARLA